MSKVARVGKREEMDFAEDASRAWAGIWISPKSFRATGISSSPYRAPNGEPTEPRILVDNKDKAVIAEGDIEKLVRDAKERSILSGRRLVAHREESQLRQVDRDSRWCRKDGVWLLPRTISGNGSFETLTCSSRSSNA